MKFALLFGGASYEHEISIVSAIALKKVLPIEIFLFLDAEGAFWEIPAEKMRSDHFSSGGYRKDTPLTLTRGGWLRRGLLKSKPLEGFDTVINLVHGAQGEDGTIAALLDFYEIAYIGPRLEASVVSFNKRLSKLYAEGAGVGTVPWQTLHIDGDRRVDFDMPLIVKPLRLGSSIGVSVVREPERFDYALDVAFEFDDEVLVEPFLEGVREYNVAGCRIGDEWVIGRIEAPRKGEYLDFEQKYLDFGRTDEVSEADIDETLRDKLIESFKKIYADTFEGALIRCDFFVHDDAVLLNEINPIPGSLANYLFDDFAGMMTQLGGALPKRRKIVPDYAYIDKVARAKGPKAR